MNDEQINELLYQALETELGGQKIYETAITCASNEDLKEEWQKYLAETQHHQEVLLATFQQISLDPKVETPGRKIVRHHGESLVQAMNMALKSAPDAAQIVAAECVVLAETKDHQNWELIGMLGEKVKGPKGKALGKALLAAYEEVEDQEDEHLYHTRGWSRELWIESLGMPAVLPPPEEEKQVKTAIGAARAEQARGQML